jgi:hypothetical protein
MKQKASNGVGEAARLASVLQGTETAQSLDFQLALIEKKAHELWKRKALEQEGRAIKSGTAITGHTKPACRARDRAGSDPAHS